MTTIEWTDVTWNPTTGCDRVSPGCDHCYAMTLAPRLKAMGSAKYQRDGDPRTSGPGFGITQHPGTLDEPLSWRKPRRVFVNSMSDLFHDGVSDAFIWSVWIIMARTPQHTYQVLTKRHGRMRSLLRRWAADGWIARDLEMRWNDLSGLVVNDALPNVWLGVSVEDQKRADLRIPALLDTPATVRFLSCEPLLGPVQLADGKGYCRHHRGEVVWEGDPRTHPACCECGRPWSSVGVDWVIVGGESGRGARPMAADWARRLRNQCESAQVPFFFKQWGEWTCSCPPGPAHDPPDTWVSHEDGRTADEDTAMAAGGSWTGVYRVGKKTAGRRLDGRMHDEFPVVAS